MSTRSVLRPLLAALPLVLGATALHAQEVTIKFSPPRCS